MTAGVDMAAEQAALQEPPSSSNAIAARLRSLADHPRLESAHLRNARLYADRDEMIAGLGVPRGGAVAEVGVGSGAFSARLISALAPRTFVAIDRFDMHLLPEIWGMPTRELFGGLTHVEHYCGQIPSAIVEVGESHECLARRRDGEFDLIYVDAGHTYEDVKRDAFLADRKAKPDGVLVFNDYTLGDHVYRTDYGVVQAVNELVTSTDWRVVGFALDRLMFCDIALRRV